MNNFLKVILVGLLLSMVCSGAYHIPSVGAKKYDTDFKARSVEDIKILALIDHGFGDNYFTIKNQLEDWGCNVTTAGVATVVQSCPNKDPNPVTSDILIAEVDQAVLAEFDCIFIPAGGHWNTLAYNMEALDLIATAYEEGLAIATLCIGSMVLANAHNIVDGVKVTNYHLSSTNMEAAGGILTNARVVTDQHIITGGSGAMRGTNAPIYQICIAIMKEVLGISYVLNTTLEPSSGSIETNFTINVETTSDFSEVFTTGFSTEISTVTAYVYLENENVTPIKTVELTDKDQDNIYSGNFTGLEAGKYYVDVEVKNHGEGLEVLRNAGSFSIVAAVPGYEFPISIICLALVSLIFIKDRRSKKKFKK
ncbi:MAG: DJ-1/PfpI family protein [Promethearchaeota archaeon]